MRRLYVFFALLTLLAFGAAEAQGAAVKPKNGVIAFSAKRGNTRVLYTRNSNGTGLKLLPTQGKADKPSVSTAGERVAFTRYGGSGAQIWVEYLDGTMLRQLTTGPLDS